MASKPDDKYEDPADLAAIEFAQENMGDYKLKTDPEYVVPEHLRINAEKKRRQMVCSSSIYVCMCMYMYICMYVWRFQAEGRAEVRCA